MVARCINWHTKLLVLMGGTATSPKCPTPFKWSDMRLCVLGMIPVMWFHCLKSGGICVVFGSREYAKYFQSACTYSPMNLWITGIEISRWKTSVFLDDVRRRHLDPHGPPLKSLDPHEPFEELWNVKQLSGSWDPDLESLAATPKCFNSRAITLWVDACKRKGRNLTSPDLGESQTKVDVYLHFASFELALRLCIP